LTRTFDIIPMDYMIRAGRWKDYALNEQGFGTEGINELFKVDPDPDYQRIGDEYMKMLLKKFESEEGIWNRMYRIDEGRKVPTRYVAKSQGWATEGLLANYELTGDNMYLDKAENIAEQLMKYQSSNGSWQFIYNSGNTNETAEKATAIWSVLFYKLYHHTQNENYLQTARKALLWCLNNQYNGPDPLAHGGLVAVTRASGVIYRRWFPMECLYASGFFGLAVLEELALQEKGK